VQTGPETTQRINPDRALPIRVAQRQSVILVNRLKLECNDPSLWLPRAAISDHCRRRCGLLNFINRCFTRPAPMQRAGQAI
jgi:hypothetical protein